MEACTAAEAHVALFPAEPEDWRGARPRDSARQYVHHDTRAELVLTYRGTPTAGGQPVMEGMRFEPDAADHYHTQGSTKPDREPQVSAQLFQDDTLFLVAPAGGTVQLAGADEKADIPLPRDCWGRLAGPTTSAA